MLGYTAALIFLKKIAIYGNLLLPFCIFQKTLILHSLRSNLLLRFFCNFSTIWAGWTQSRIIGRSPASMIMKKASILCYSLNNNIFSSYIHYYLSGTINTNKYNNNSKHTEDVYDSNICMSHPTLSSWVFSVKKIPEKCFKICHIFLGKKEKTQIIVMKRLAIFSLLSAKRVL